MRAVEYSPLVIKKKNYVKINRYSRRVYFLGQNGIGTERLDVLPYKKVFSTNVYF